MMQAYRLKKSRIAVFTLSCFSFSAWLSLAFWPLQNTWDQAEAKPTKTKAQIETNTVSITERCSALPLAEVFSKTGRLAYLERAALEHQDQAPVVIGLHGLGHHKEGFARLSAQLPKTWHLYYIDAPFKYHRGYAWYRFRCPQAEADLQVSVKALNATILHIRSLHSPTQRPSVFGFSQGAVMSVTLLNEHPTALASVTAFSGYWLSAHKPQKVQNDSVPELLLVHGEFDRTVSFKKGLQLAKWMGEAGYPLAWLPFLGGHQINDEGLNALIQQVESSRIKAKSK